MSDAETNTAIVSPPTLVRVKGQEFLCEKATTSMLFEIYDYAVVEARKRYNPFKEVCDSLAGLDVTPEQKESLLRQAHQVKLSGEVPPEDVTAFMKTAAGLAYQLWVLSRKNHPERTLTSIEGLIDDRDRIDLYVQLDAALGANLVAKLMKRSGFQPALPPASTGSSPTAAVQGSETCTKDS